jgi:hypothetical protein
MARFVIIFSTVVKSSFDPDQMEKVLANFKGIMEWSYDLEDTDKILRVVCSENICYQLSSALQKAGISALALAVFKRTNRGPEQIL